MTMENRESLHSDAGASKNRILFVTGLHRSATSLVTRLLAKHEQISGFENTGVKIEEGQFLQSVIRGKKGEALAGVGSLALKPKNWLTEKSPIATPANAEKLFDEWSKYWDLSKPVLIEKSPGNLTKLRLLNAMFPSSQFIILVRHPVAQAMAIHKWASNRTVVQHIANWTVAHMMLRRNAGHINNLSVVRYEDFCNAPEEALSWILAHQGLEPMDSDIPKIRNSNGAYFEKWKALEAEAKFAWQAVVIRSMFSRECERWGYNLRTADLSTYETIKVGSINCFKAEGNDIAT